MNQVIQAVYENGVLRPLGKLELGEHQQVQITVDLDTPSGGRSEQSRGDPLDGIRAATGIRDLAEHFDDYPSADRAANPDTTKDRCRTDDRSSGCVTEAVGQSACWGGCRSSIPRRAGST
jgi:predicted DNA-binding antitoxin AbrB/MazE fold protein